jgi:hypothetical protein
MLSAGVASIALGAINLFHERHVAEVDNLYVGVGAVIGLIWLASLVLAFRGVKPAVAVAAAVAFTEFGIIASSHFVTGPSGMSAFVKSEGITAAPILMALMVSCLLTFMTAVVCWSHPTGRLKRIRMLPFLLSSVVGATLVILYATDSVRRDDFGTASQEDGTFAAVVSATFWLFGGLWIARVRKTGALLIGLGTFMATFSFTALHLAKGGHTVSEIAAASGPAWAVVATAMAGLAYISLAFALTVLLVSLFVRRRSTARPATATPARRSGSG